MNDLNSIWIVAGLLGIDLSIESLAERAVARVEFESDNHGLYLLDVLRMPDDADYLEAGSE